MSTSASVSVKLSVCVLSKTPLTSVYPKSVFPVSTRSFKPLIPKVPVDIPLPLFGKPVPDSTTSNIPSPSESRSK